MYKVLNWTELRSYFGWNMFYVFELIPISFVSFLYIWIRFLKQTNVLLFKNETVKTKFAKNYKCETTEELQESGLYERNEIIE